MDRYAYRNAKGDVILHEENESLTGGAREYVITLDKNGDLLIDGKHRQWGARCARQGETNALWR